MEERLNDWSAAQYKEALARKTDEMAMPFRSKATKLDGKISDFKLVLLQFWSFMKYENISIRDFKKLFEIDLITNSLEKGLKY